MILPQMSFLKTVMKELSLQMQLSSKLSLAYTLLEEITCFVDCIFRLYMIIYLFLSPFYLVYRAIIGELDAEKDASLNLEELRAEPLRPVLHS